MKRLLICSDVLGYSLGEQLRRCRHGGGQASSVGGGMTNMRMPFTAWACWRGTRLPGAAHQHLRGASPRPPARIPSLCTPEGGFKPSFTYRDAAKAR